MLPNGDKSGAPERRWFAPSATRASAFQKPTRSAQVLWDPEINAAPAASLSFRSTLSQWLFSAVWFEGGLKREAIEGAFDRRHAARRELRTRVVWQNKKAPGAGLWAPGRPAEFRFETDLGSGLGHFPEWSRKISDLTIVSSARQSRQLESETVVALRSFLWGVSVSLFRALISRSGERAATPQSRS